MFYTYDLSFERASAIAHALSLTVANSETSTAGTRKNGVLLPLAIVSPQIICGVPDPFSGDFSGDFGGGPSGYVLVTVNKFLKMADAQAYAISKTTFHLNSKILSAASSQAAHIASLHLAVLVLIAFSAEAVALGVARPFHAIVAATNGAVSRALKALSKGALQAVDALAVSVTRSSARAFSAVSGEAGGLAKAAGLLRGLVSTEVTSAIKTGGKVLKAGSSEAFSLLRSLGRQFGASEPEAVLIVRGLPWHVNASSSESARLGFGGGNLFARVFGAASGEAMGLQRGQAVLRGLPEANAAGAIKTPGKVVASLDAEAAALLKQAEALRGSIDAQVVASRLRTGLVKGAIDAAIQASATAGAHLLGVLVAINAQVASAFTQHVLGRSLSIPHPQSSSVAISSVRTLLRTISVASTQATNITRGIAKSVSAVMAAAQRLARSPGKTLGATSANVSALLSVALHFFVSGVASPEAVQQRASHSAVKATTSTEIAAVIHQHGQFLSAADANAANVTRSMAKILGAINVQAIAVGRFIGKSFTTTSGGAAAAIKSLSRLMSAVSSEATASITRKGSSLGTVSSAQMSGLRRLTGKLALAFDQQAVAGGRGGSKRIGVTSPNAALMIRPRGFFLGTTQRQSAASITVYHFFVATWAFQQTSLLPPFGGPAEPPSFGPIDPADQTIFAFDWSSRIYPNDTILSASVTCVPPGLPFLGSVFISGTLVQVTVPPFPAPVLPTAYSLRCTAKFASGRVSSFSIPVPVRTL